MIVDSRGAYNLIVQQLPLPSVLDLRSKEDFETQHIIKSRNFPLKEALSKQSHEVSPYETVYQQMNSDQNLTTFFRTSERCVVFCDEDICLVFHFSCLLSSSQSKL